jgi:hypothetical protein
MYTSKVIQLVIIPTQFGFTEDLDTVTITHEDSVNEKLSDCGDCLRDFPGLKVSHSLEPASDTELIDFLQRQHDLLAQAQEIELKHLQG